MGYRYVPVTDEQVATLRAQLAGDVEEYGRRWQRLDKEEAKRGYTALVVGGLFEAVDRRFNPDSPASDVVEFVGDVRARSERVGEELDPIVAERVIRHSLGHGSISDIDPETRSTAPAIILTALVADEQLDDEGLDEFLAPARELGDRLMS